MPNTTEVTNSNQADPKPPVVNDHKKKTRPQRVTIAGIEYPLPSLGRMNRAGVKRLQPLLSRVTTSDGDDLEMLWDLADALLQNVPTEDVDNLGMDDLKTILSESGMLTFDGEDAPDPANLTITLGESSASTVS